MATNPASLNMSYYDYSNDKCVDDYSKYQCVNKAEELCNDVPNASVFEHPYPENKEQLFRQGADGTLSMLYTTPEGKQYCFKTNNNNETRIIIPPKTSNFLNNKFVSGSVEEGGEPELSDSQKKFWGDDIRYGAKEALDPPMTNWEKLKKLCGFNPF